MVGSLSQHLFKTDAIQRKATRPRERCLPNVFCLRMGGKRCASNVPWIPSLSPILSVSYCRQMFRMQMKPHEAQLSLFSRPNVWFSENRGRAPMRPKMLPFKRICKMLWGNWVGWRTLRLEERPVSCTAPSRTWKP